MDFRKIVGMSFLTFILISYLSYRAEWNWFMYIHMIQFFKFNLINPTDQYWYIRVSERGIV